MIIRIPTLWGRKTQFELHLENKYICRMYTIYSIYIILQHIYIIYILQYTVYIYITTYIYNIILCVYTFIYIYIYTTIKFKPCCAQALPSGRWASAGTWASEVRLRRSSYVLWGAVVDLRNCRGGKLGHANITPFFKYAIRGRNPYQAPPGHRVMLGPC